MLILHSKKLIMRLSIFQLKMKKKNSNTNRDSMGKYLEKDKYMLLKIAKLMVLLLNILRIILQQSLCLF